MKKEFIQKVIAVQQALRAPKEKGGSEIRYKYRTAEQIYQAAKPLLLEHGLLLYVSDRPVQVGERYYIEATAHLTDGEDEITNTAYARESQSARNMGEGQLSGSTSSYARKYAICGMFLVDDNHDLDDENVREDVMQSEKADTIDNCLLDLLNCTDRHEFEAWMRRWKDEVNTIAEVKQAAAEAAKKYPRPTK